VEVKVPDNPSEPVGDSLPPRDAVIEADKKHIDRTLLRQNLRRTPTERVANLMALQRLAAEAKRAVELRKLTDD
jgi:hypothetical protein